MQLNCTSVTLIMSRLTELFFSESNGSATQPTLQLLRSEVLVSLCLDVFGLIQPMSFPVTCRLVVTTFCDEVCLSTELRGFPSRLTLASLQLLSLRFDHDPRGPMSWQ